jgi:PPOX class probable F420-dependent enzyme
MNAEPRKVRGHIPWEAVDARLKATRSTIVSTVRPDGRPHAIPVWYVWNGGSAVYFTTTRGSQKQKNLSHQPYAVVHFGNGDDVLFAEGGVAIVPDGDEKKRVDADYQAKYVDPVSSKRASVYDNPKDDLYRVDVVRFVTWMYGTARGWTEWRFD